MIQQAIVGVIVLVAAWVVIRKYLPRTMRRRLAAVCARRARSLRLPSLATWLETDVPPAANCADGCGTCGSCGTDAAGAATLADGKPAEFAMPVEALRATIRRKH